MMRILILEDEARISKRIERFVSEILKDQTFQLFKKHSLYEAEYFLEDSIVDLVLLDLNLNGKDGFDILKKLSAESFHTIIISAHTERATEAFEYGVLDFVPKPFDYERLEKAFLRLQSTKGTNQLKHVAVKKGGRILLLNIDDIKFFKGSGSYSNVVMKDDSIHLHDKTLESLGRILPPNFERIHKSYLVNFDGTAEIITSPGSKYELRLKDGSILPIGRSRYKNLKQRLI